MKPLKLLMSIAVISLLSAGAQADDHCETTVDSTDSMQFDTDSVTVDTSCDTFTVTLTHSGQLPKNVMGHNWVLTLTEDLRGVAQDGISAGLDNDYIKPGDDRVIAHTEVIGGGGETSVTFDVSKLDPDADYTFFCSFPGHSSVMQGDLILE